MATARRRWRSVAGRLEKQEGHRQEVCDSVFLLSCAPAQCWDHVISDYVNGLAHFVRTDLVYFWAQGRWLRSVVCCRRWRCHGWRQWMR